MSTTVAPPRTSTAKPPPDPRRGLPRALRPVRMLWRRLTSMRTALILLFLLAVAAVPGSLLPQESLAPSRVQTYLQQHGAWGRFLQHLGFFDVFGSPWFAAIYLLLFVSLVGCLIPRIRVHARAIARPPLPAPKTLSRLPESGRFETSAAPATYASAAREVLGRRWRVVQRSEADGRVTLSAEKGYSRETGNLIFHVALLAALVLVAIGQLYKYEGNVIVQQGQGFCNTPSAFDQWKPGRLAADGRVQTAPFCLKLNRFVATYTAAGEATEFAASVGYQPQALAAHPGTRSDTITVNHPLRLEGDRVYLIGHGFAPMITLRMPDGEIRHDTEPFVPSNGATLYSEGAFKQPGSQDAAQDVGLQAFFAPTPVDQGHGIISSSSPRVDNPVLGLFAYVGTLDATGAAQSVYTVDHTAMHLVGKANLHIGQTATLRDGVRVTFDGWQPWASLQVSHDPSQGFLLIAALAMVVGLGASLGVRRRRVWLRMVPAPGGAGDGPTLVSVGGLARSDSGNFTTEFSGLLGRLSAAAAPPGAYASTLHTSLDAPNSGIAGKD